MGDPDAVLPLNLGFVGESEKQPMEIEGGGNRSAGILELAPGKKRPPSPPTPGDEFDSPTSSTRDEWLLSDSGSEEDEDNQGPPETMLFPPFKTGKHAFGSDYNLADTSEISVRGVGDCSPNECRCFPMDLLQFVSIKISGYQHTHSGPAKIYGFVAARDTIEPLRNHVYRRKIDNCEAVTVKSKTGVARLSLISPVRVISFSSRVLIEFELHAQSDNGPIIEGCTELYNMFAYKSFIEETRLCGEKCALDIKYLVLINAVEAQVHVKVLHLSATPSGINMKLCAKTSDFNEVICLFQGAAPDPGDTMSFVIAAERRKGFDLYIEGSARDDHFLGTKLRASWWRCFFAAGYHAMDEREAKLGEFATVSVKVTWRTHRKKALNG